METDWGLHATSPSPEELMPPPRGGGAGVNRIRLEEAADRGLASLFQGGSVPSEAAPSIGNGVGTENGIDLVDGADAIDMDIPAEKRAKTCTSDVWKYYSKEKKVVEVDGVMVGQSWATCNVEGCNHSARCEGVCGTSGFWYHMKAKHGLVKDTQVDPEKDQGKGTKVVENYRVVKQIYQCYVPAAPTSLKTNSDPSDALFHDDGDEDFGSYVCESYDPSEDTSNELERYMTAPLMKSSKANADKFDILAWWKNQHEEYPVLSQLARDVLAIQASTVASESAFSAGGRILDPYRSRLDPEMVQALICSKDWIAAQRRDSKSIASIVGDLEVLETLANTVTLQEEDNECEQGDET